MSNPYFNHRSCYVNFAGHLLNRFNPNMIHPGLPYQWSDDDWFRFVDMIAAFGFNVFEFWLVPKLFSYEGINSKLGNEFARQINSICQYAKTKNVKVKNICSLATVGSDWHTNCPNIQSEWVECLELWECWVKKLSHLDIWGIFPGDPGACSINGCTAETFIDKSLEVSQLIKKNNPCAQIELNTWGNPFFGWGTIKGPEGWHGEFVQDYQHTAWIFDKGRAERAMMHLLKKIPDFPDDTLVSINLAFNPDGNPDEANGDQDARGWANEIAKTNGILTWDFSLTEGENAIIPHYRFERLFAKRRKEIQAAPYQGGICFTMTPLLNQLSLYESAQSFIDPKADYKNVARKFYSDIFGGDGEKIVDILPLFEIIPDWGNDVKIEMSREEYHRHMSEGVELIRSFKNSLNYDIPFHPGVEEYRKTLLWYFELFAQLSGNACDYEAAYKKYWNYVYGIYEYLPEHVDPRPKLATDNLFGVFDPTRKVSDGPMAGRWV